MEEGDQVVVGRHVMTAEERAWRRAQYASRDRAHSAMIRARCAEKRAREKAADAARLAVEVARIRSEIRFGLKPPRGTLAAVDTAAMLLIGPLGAVGIGGALLPKLQVLAVRGRHPVPELLAAGPWQDEAVLRAGLEAIRPKLTAIGLRVCRRKGGVRFTRTTDATPSEEVAQFPLSRPGQAQT